MAINQNHTFDDLDGIKCAIVEKLVTPARVSFLRRVLEYNNYTVVVVASPPPKVAVPPKPAGDVTDTPVEQPLVVALPETFTVGVTDVMFNATNAIFGRFLNLPGGHIVTMAYWQEKESVSHDEVPYFELKS